MVRKVKKGKKAIESDYSFFLVVILIVVLSGGFYVLTWDNVKVESKQNIKQDSISSDFVFPISKKVSNVVDCDSLENIAEKQKCVIDNMDCALLGDDCYLTKAFFYSKVSFCGNIVSNDLNDFCLSSLVESEIVVNAVLKDDVNLCDSFDVENKVGLCRDNFYFSKSYNLKDLSFCDSIENSLMKDRCLAY